MAKKKGIDVNSVILIIVVVLVVGLSLGIFYKAPVGEAGEGELAQMAGGEVAGMVFVRIIQTPYLVLIVKLNLLVVQKLSHIVP